MDREPPTLKSRVRSKNQEETVSELMGGNTGVET